MAEPKPNVKKIYTWLHNWFRVKACLLRRRIIGPTPTQLSEQQLEAIRRWAQGITQISEVRLFGSRAMGCARPDSDVDLAITVGFGHYVAIANQAEAELSRRLGLIVKLHHYNSPETTIIRRYCDDCSVLLFPT